MGLSDEQRKLLLDEARRIREQFERMQGTDERSLNIKTWLKTRYEEIDALLASNVGGTVQSSAIGNEPVYGNPQDCGEDIAGPVLGIRDEKQSVPPPVPQRSERRPVRVTRATKVGIWVGLGCLVILCAFLMNPKALGEFFPILILIGLLIAIVTRSLRSKEKGTSNHIHCPNCSYEGPAKREFSTGQLLMMILLLFVCFPILIVFALFAIGQQSCPICRWQHPVPLNQWRKTH